MDELLYLAISAAGAVTFWWRYRRRAGQRKLLPPHDEEIQVVLHVAAHEARARRQPLRPEHLLLALVESESVSEAIRSAGGDPSAVEDRTFAALDSPPGEELLYTLRRLDPAAAVVELASALARHHGRSARPADLWFALMRPGLGCAELVTASGVDPTAVLFVLAHGAAERADAASAGDADVELVLVNDDFSPQQLVVEVLREALGLGQDEAERLMLAAHSQGRASLGRHPGARAQQAADATRSRARQHGYPLWIQLVP